MKRKIDFIIYEDDNEKIIFRFYPRSSHVHSFNDIPPTNWGEVYKVYFSYAIIRQTRWDVKDKWESEIMYNEGFDECSCIDQVSETLKDIIAGKYDDDKYEFRPCGDGTSYEIRKYQDWNNVAHWEFLMFQSYTNKGYRFNLNKAGIQKFADTIDYYLEYMLKHGDGI